MSVISFTCNAYKLLSNEKFIVLTNDTVGLYSGDTASQISTSTDSSNTTTYSMQGNQSNISCNAATVEPFSIAIKANISMYIASA